MYTPTALDYRLAVRITVSGKHYYFSRRHFMKRFVEFSEKKLRVNPHQRLMKQDYHVIKSLKDFELASQSFDETVDDRTLWVFEIADRLITGGHKSNRYLRDELLTSEYNGKFRLGGATYPDMAKFLNSEHVSISDVAIVEQMIEVFTEGRENTDDCPLIPLMLAVLLIAEPSRSPSAFLPTLLLLDLIRHERYDSFGEKYTLVDSLCNPVLSGSERGHDPITGLPHEILLSMVGMPTQRDVDHARDVKAAIDAGDHSQQLPMMRISGSKRRSFFNVGGANNGTHEPDNIRRIKHSDAAMRTGGWGSMAAKHSYTEMYGSNADPDQHDINQQRELTGHIKSFCILVDWLHMKDCAMPMHRSDVERLSRIVLFDCHDEILEGVFNDLFDGVQDYLTCATGDPTQFFDSHDTMHPAVDPAGAFEKLRIAQQSLDEGTADLEMREEIDPRIADLIAYKRPEQKENQPVPYILLSNDAQQQELKETKETTVTAPKPMSYRDALVSTTGNSSRNTALMSQSLFVSQSQGGPLAQRQPNSGALKSDASRMPR